MKKIELLEKQDSIYLVKHIGLPGVYKLGVTSCLKNRLSTMNCSSPYGVEVVYVEYTEYHRLIENSLLEKWKCNRVNGEWLELNESELELLKSEIKALAQVVSSEPRDYENSREAIKAAGYSIAMHPKYKYKKNGFFQITWKYRHNKTSNEVN